MADLGGKVIALLESRRAAEMAGLVTRHGGIPYAAPALREVPLENRQEVAAFIDAMVADPPAVTICLTGAGTRALFDAAAHNGKLQPLLAAIAAGTVVARGPKPVRVLRDYGVRVDLVPPEPSTSRELLEILEPLNLRERVVALQHYGEPNTYLQQALMARGARLREVFLYAWAPPADQAPLERFIEDVQQGRIDVVAATSQSQIKNLFALADHFGQTAALRDALERRVAVAAVGPVTAEAWRRAGVPVAIEPEHPHMGHLVLAIAAYLEARSPV